MNDDRLTVLKKLYDNTFNTREEIQDMIQNNLNRLEEISFFLNSVEQSETVDYKIFSPRSVENIHRDKITEYKAEREKLQNSNNNYYEKLKVYEKQLTDIKQLIKTITDDKNHAMVEEFKNLTILDIQEKERIRIARELHDSSLQNLTHIIHEIELSSKFIDQDPIRAKLELVSCSQNLKHTIDEIRDTIFNLRPMSFDDLGFGQCIENFVDVCKKQFKDLQIDYDVEDIDIINKEETNLYLVTLYRVIQEAVFNSLKHSKAEKIKILVRDEGSKLLVNVIDNGKGFLVDNMVKDMDNKEKHFGLSIMKERIYLLNGSIKIDSQLDIGTKIEIVVPKPYK